MHGLIHEQDSVDACMAKQPPRPLKKEELMEHPCSQDIRKLALQINEQNDIEFTVNMLIGLAKRMENKKDSCPLAEMTDYKYYSINELSYIYDDYVKLTIKYNKLEEEYKKLKDKFDFFIGE